MRTLDDIKAALCTGEFSSFTIQFNDHASNYQTVAAAFEENSAYFTDDDFAAPDERQRCIDTNSLWTAHWYPNTPVGFCLAHAATYATLHARLEQLAFGDAAPEESCAPTYYRCVRTWRSLVEPNVDYGVEGNVYVLQEPEGLLPEDGYIKLIGLAEGPVFQKYGLRGWLKASRFVRITPEEVG